MKKSAKRIIIILFWLLIWQIIADRLGKPIFLVGPRETLTALSGLVGDPSFWKVIFHSTARIALGFFGAFFLGLLAGSASYRLPFLEEVLAPILGLMKTVPVASFVILALIWAGADQLTLVVSFFVIFPIVYKNTIAGLKATDPKLLEMAKVFSVSSFGRIWQIERPALAPYLYNACELGLGMAWKSGVAAEVIGTPDFSIGEKLYIAKIFFSTGELFAWTLVILILSTVFEKLVLFFFRQVMEVRP